MKKKFLTFSIFFTIFCFQLSLAQSNTNTNKVCFQNHCFDIEIAKTYTERLQGLKQRDNLESSAGMLFVFKSEGEYNFWMKDVLIPLDIIWINKDKEVVFIKRNAQPCKNNCKIIKPKQKAKYVLELNAGITAELGMQVGDKLNFNIGDNEF